MYLSKPCVFHLPSVLVPGLESSESRLMKPKEPAPSGSCGPFCFRWWYSSSVGSLHGSPPQFWSIGCCSLTTIGATQRACAGVPARALAFAPTVTEWRPKSLEKKPGVGRSTLTETVSFETHFVVNSTSPASTEPPFLSP